MLPTLNSFTILYTKYFIAEEVENKTDLKGSCQKELHVVIFAHLPLCSTHCFTSYSPVPGNK